MNYATRRGAALAWVLLSAGSAPLVSADIIYNNSVNDLQTRFDPGTVEVGDEILLAGTARYATNFSFEYWGNASGATFTGTVEARVKFYQNDGTPFNGYATPGTAFFDSGWFDGFGPTGGATNRATLVFTSAGGDFPSGGLFIPTSDLTWSVQFRNLGAGDAVGVDLYSPATVGSGFPDYWQNTAGSWALVTNSVPVDFAARLSASETVVPEPSALALLIFGGLGAALVQLRPAKIGSQKKAGPSLDRLFAGNNQT